MNKLTGIHHVRTNHSTNCLLQKWRNPPVGAVFPVRKTGEDAQKTACDYDFKLKVINYYAKAGISVTISRFFSITDDGPKGSKRKLVLKWKHQRAQIEQRAGTVATSGNQRSRDCGLTITLPQSAETSIVNWLNDFHRDRVPVSSATLKTRAFEEAEN
uniref:AlNc14C111G6380 protein n=1 Tax=Albugo laibachii Nc14 TaxID=890382 RepID=F0WII0_9STRA|nr:AlNc14C111G6380 [Albugo laibachii Nc14]|eukprot:CCA21062.1 AlNc14C111G6380 [Albugo laibachii Nc14]